MARKEMQRKSVKGHAYSPEWISMFSHWEDSSGTAPREIEVANYSVLDFFGPDEKQRPRIYLGPDEYGIEPVFDFSPHTYGFNHGV